MAQIFAYIVHKDGVADDTALELLTAAGSIFLAAVQGEKGGDSDRIPFKLSVAEALEMAFKLRLAARIIILNEMGVDEHEG